MKKLNFKIIGKTLLMTIINSIIYYIIKFIQSPPSLIGSALDKKIPFIDHFIYFYILWYILLITIPYFFYKTEKKSYDKYCTLYILCAITANIIFLIYPTTITREIITPNTITLQLVDIIYFLDTPAVNCLPSMHCICCFLFIVVTLQEKKIDIKNKILITTISTLIVLSTLFIKQHVLYDVLLALIIVIIYNFIYEKFIKKRTNKKGI